MNTLLTMLLPELSEGPRVLNDLASSLSSNTSRRSEVSAHGMIVLLRRQPTKTATRNSDSLPVYELVF